MSTGRNLTPADGVLYVVRWERYDKRDVMHKYYRRLVDADRLAKKLRSVGRDVAIYETSAEWHQR